MTDDDDWPDERRRIDACFLKDQLGENLNGATYMVAGPPGMATAVTVELQRVGVDAELIATDSFSGY
jgi:ferredoxin-NADP reductase